MTSTVFTPGTVITSPWLNDVNTATYTTVPNNTASIATNTAAIATLNGSTGAANVGYTPAGTGAVATTVQTKLRQYVSVMDFGAVGDSTTDDTAAIQAAADYCTTNNKTLFIPSPPVAYKLTSTVTLACSTIGEVAQRGSIPGQFICTTEITAFILIGSRLKYENLGVYFNLSSTATSAIGFKFGSSTVQFSNNTCVQLYVRYAYRSFLANTAGTGTLWNNTFINCRSDFQVDYAWYFAALVGSTTQTWINCMVTCVVGGVGSGWYTSNIDDVMWISGQADNVSDGKAIYVNLATSATVKQFRCETPSFITNGSRLIYVNASLELDNLKVQSAIFNPGAGNRATLVGLGTTGSSRIGAITNEGNTITSGIVYKVDTNGLQFGTGGRCIITGTSIYRADVRMDDNGDRTVFANKSFIIAPSNYNDPTVGNYEIGDTFRTAGINATTQPKVSRVCTTAGTAGTLSAVTGSITSGETTLTVNTTTGLKENVYITIAGVSGVKRITQVLNTTLVYIDSAADATVVAAAVAYSTPVFRISERLVFKGATGSRPTSALGATDYGIQYLDTTLAAGGKPIWWNGTAWVDYSGTVV